MKKITFLALLSILTLSTIAQNKFGHINAQEILSLMPEYKVALEALENRKNTLHTQYGGMEAELQATFADYQNTAESLDELTRQDKEVEIKNLQQRIQNFQQSAQQTLQDEEIKLLEPVMAKARKAIEDVATEGNYTYIFDQSNGTILYAKESENVIDLVKKKLNL